MDGSLTSRQRSSRKYDRSPARKLVRRRYAQSTKGKEALKRSNQRKAERNKAIIQNAKSQPCADCGHVFPHFCMDFHHASGEKRFVIGRTVGRGTKELLLEIAKCIVICSNCHRIRHHSEGKLA